MGHGKNGYLGVTGTNQWGNVLTWSLMTKKFEVLPIVFIISGLCVGVGCFCCYSACTKDFQFWRDRPPVHETMNLRKPFARKLLTIQQKYEPMPELADLLEEICECKSPHKK